MTKKCAKFSIKNDSYSQSTGMPTGKCVNSTIKKGTKVCEIKGWCPLGINIY